MPYDALTYIKRGDGLRRHQNTRFDKDCGGLPSPRRYDIEIPLRQIDPKPDRDKFFRAMREAGYPEQATWDIISHHHGIPDDDKIREIIRRKEQREDAADRKAEEEALDNVLE